MYILDVSYVCCILVFLCCTCFLLFSESQEARGVMVVWHGCGGIGCGKLGAGERDARHIGVLQTGCAQGRRSERDRGRVCLRGGANSLQPRRTGKPACARRVVQTHGCCDTAGCACGAGKQSENGGRLREGPDVRIRRDIQSLALRFQKNIMSSR